MAIKATINNTEKEIEQIKNSDEQDIDYVYSRIGDTEVEGAPPISIKSIGGNFSNYRIYGQTVDGESVGDRTANLFDGEWTQGSVSNTGDLNNEKQNRIKTIVSVIPSQTYTIRTNLSIRMIFAYNDTTEESGIVSKLLDIMNGVEFATITIPDNANLIAVSLMSSDNSNITPSDVEWTMLNTGSTALPYEPHGYKVPVTVEGKNLFDGEFLQGYWAGSNGAFVSASNWICIKNKITCNPNTPYTLSFSVNSRSYGFAWYDVSGNYISSSDMATTLPCKITAVSPNNAYSFGISIAGYPDHTGLISPEDVTDLMVVEGSTALPYEPYHAPVTTNIYLPEQIKMVGNEAEYIDYAEQKQHRVRKNLCQINKTNNAVISHAIEGQIYTFSLTADFSVGFRILKRNADSGSTEAVASAFNREGRVSATFTANENFDVYVNGFSAVDGKTFLNLVHDFMFEKGATASEYEPYIENTELDVTLPALSTIKGTNTLSVNTSIQPSNIYTKDNFDYKRIFTATRVIEDGLPLNYKSIEDSDSTLKNYRIYGNTVNGESVGDRTGNLVDKTKFVYGYRLSNIGTLYTTPSEQNLFAVSEFIEVNSGEQYIISQRDATRGYARRISFYQSKNENSWLSNNDDSDLIFTVPNTATYLRFTALQNYIDSIMLIRGTSLPTQYEPYGYKVPVTVEGKNLLPNTVTSRTNNGVTFTVNSDGSVTCNGTANGGAALFWIPAIILPAGQYSINGCPVGGDENTTYKILILANNEWLTNDKGSGANFTLTETSTVSVRMAIYNGYTCDNLTFYPMIRKADIEDDTYDPYHAPVTTPIYLPEPIKMVGGEAEFIDYAEQKQHRVRKNLLKITLASAGATTYDGVSISNNDGILTLNGTSNNGSFVNLATAIKLPIGNYILTGGSENLMIRFQKTFSGYGFDDTGAGRNIVCSEEVTSGVCSLKLTANYTYNNVKVYPMIRKADITDDIYEPYIENTEVDVTLPALPTQSSTNSLSVGTEIEPSNIYIKGKIKSLD